MEKIVYVGLFLTPASREKLLATFPPAFARVHADHLTLKFKPSERDLASYKPAIGHMYTLFVIAHHTDVKGQAVEIAAGTVPLCDNVYPHITISTNEGVSPVYSNDLIRSIYSGLRDMPPSESILRLEAVLDTFPRSMKEQ